MSCQRRVLFSAFLRRRSGLTEELEASSSPLYRLQGVSSRVLPNRDKEILEIIIHSNQTYCGPDRTMIDVCKLYNLNLAIVSLDQEKAFDRVYHSIFCT